MEKNNTLHAGVNQKAVRRETKKLRRLAAAFFDIICS